MKYVSDHFSTDMIQESTYIIIPKTLKKNIFKKSVKKAKSCISSKKIAKMLHKPRYTQDIHLKIGDELYLVTNDFGRKHSCDIINEKKFRYEVFIIS